MTIRRRALLAIPAAALVVHEPARAKNPGLAQAVMPAWLLKISAQHPRLLIRPHEVDAFGAFVRSSDAAKSLATALKRLDLDADRLLPPQEPSAVLGRSAAQTEAARQAWRTASNTAFTAQLFALKALIHGRSADRDAGIRWLTALAGWRLTTSADYHRNPEAFVQALHGMVFAYDWLHDAMTPAVREPIESALSQRLATLSALIRARLPQHQRITPAEGLSHPLRYVPILGHGAMALLGHNPAAEEQLAWVFEFYTTQFPVWGGDDGGWSEGIEYQTSGLSQHLRLLEDLSSIGVSEPLARPFWRNTGYFLAHFLPPYESSSFSDLPTPPRPTASRRLLVEKLAHLNRDGGLMRLAARYGTTLPSGIDYYQYGAIDTLFHVWRTNLLPVPEAASLDTLPRSRHFADIGWVSMQSGWDDRGDTIMLGFKSSPVGSVSHGFADQNAFVINAFRHALAVSTGMRDWFGSPHYEQWTRATKSKNAILVNGQGVPARDPTATGKIVRFVSTKSADLVTGDASSAYRQVARLALRHVLFVDRRYFVMLDEISSDNPSTHQWLLHARAPMRVDGNAGTVDIQFPDAGLQAHMLVPAPDAVTVRQTDHHDPRPVASGKAVPAEWHTTIECREAVRQRNFLAVLRPWQRQAPRTPPQRLPSTSGHAIKIDNDVVLISDEATRRTLTASHELTGRAAYQLPDRLVMIEAELLRLPMIELRADVPASIDIGMTQRRWAVELQPHPALVLTLTTEKSALRISGPPGLIHQTGKDSRVLVLQLPASSQVTHVQIEW